MKTKILLTPNISKIEKQEIKAESSIEKEDDYPTYNTSTRETIDAESKMTLKGIRKNSYFSWFKKNKLEYEYNCSTIGNKQDDPLSKVRSAQY